MPLPTILWDNTYNPITLSLDAVLAHIRNDDVFDGLIYEPLSLDDVLDNTTMLDAIVVKNALLHSKMLAMKRVMNAAMSEPKLKVKEASPQISEPFTKFGTANIAALFELEGGQTVTVFFHNPDTTPKQISGEDMLISYKFLLNKKDVTIAVAPERGQDIDVRQVAIRILKLAEKNQATFERRNANRMAQIQKVAELKSQVEAKQQILNDKLAEIRRLEQEMVDKQLRADIEQEERDEALQAVNSAYQFANATDEFKIALADSLSLTDYSPFLSAKNIDSYVRVHGGSVDWSMTLEDDYLGEIKSGDEVIGFADMTDDGKVLFKLSDGSRLTTVLGEPVYATEELSSQKSYLDRLFQLVAEKQKADRGNAEPQQVVDATIVLTGKELGEFDITTDEGKKELQKATKQALLKMRGDYWNDSLKDSITVDRRGVDKSASFSGNPAKLKALAGLGQILTNGRKFAELPNDKPESKPDVEKYIYLKQEISINDEQFIAYVALEQFKDGYSKAGKYHYDLVMQEDWLKKLEKLKGTTLDSIISPETNQATIVESVTPSNGEYDTHILDNVSSGYVLNLFVYDKDGNLIEDEVEQASDSLSTQFKTWLFNNGYIERNGSMEKNISKDGEYWVGARIDKEDDILWKVRNGKEMSGIKISNVHNFDELVRYIEDFVDDEDRFNANAEFYRREEEKAEQQAKQDEYNRLNDLLFGYLDEFSALKQGQVVAHLFYTDNQGVKQTNDRVRVAIEVSQSETRPYIKNEKVDSSYKAKSLNVVERSSQKDFLYFTKDGEELCYTLQGKNALGKIAADFAIWLWDKKYPQSGSVQNEEQEKTMTENQNSDVQFLQDILSGRADVFATEFGGKFEEVAERLIGTEHEELLNQAAEYYVAETDKKAMAEA